MILFADGLPVIAILVVALVAVKILQREMEKRKR